MLSSYLKGKTAVFIDASNIYFSQKERGVNGYGFYNVNKGVYKRSKYEHDILGELHKNPGNEILFHHRKPTSTSNTENTAHPLCSKDNFEKHNYYMVHNGNCKL